MSIRPGDTVSYRWHVGAAVYGNARVEIRRGVVADVKRVDGIYFYKILGASGWVKADRLVVGEGAR